MPARVAAAKVESCELEGRRGPVERGGGVGAALIESEAGEVNEAREEGRGASALSSSWSKTSREVSGRA